MNFDDLQKTLQILQGLKTILGQQNPWIPVYAAIGGALVGAIAAIFPNIIIESIKQRREVKALTSSIVLEVSAILTTIKHRKYIESLELTVPGTRMTFRVVVPDNLFSIYHANLDRVGQIDPRIREKVVTFYHLVEAVIHDIKPGGLLNSYEAGMETWNDTAESFREAVRVGREIEHIWATHNKRVHGSEKPPRDPGTR
jgi:hypothetical protein